MLAAANTEKKKTKKLGRGFVKMEVNGPEGWKLARKKFFAVRVACLAIYYIDLLKALKREHSSPVFSPHGTLISARH